MYISYVNKSYKQRIKIEIFNDNIKLSKITQLPKLIITWKEILLSRSSSIQCELRKRISKFETRLKRIGIRSSGIGNPNMYSIIYL